MGVSESLTYEHVLIHKCVWTCVRLRESNLCELVGASESLTYEHVVIQAFVCLRQADIRTCVNTGI